MGIDAWVKPNEPQFFTEFGPPGPHVFVGFTQAETGAGLLGQGRGPFSTITGRVTNLRMSRAPAVAQFSGAPFTHTTGVVALNSGATGGSLLYAQPTNEDGTFSISGVPSGSYQLMVFDSAPRPDHRAAAWSTSTAPAPTNLHDVAVFNWFTNLYSFVLRRPRTATASASRTSRAFADQALNIRFRDGSIYQSLSTDERGFKAFNEVFPFFAWMVAEVDYARYHSTGVTIVADAGGDSTAAGSNAYNWQEQAGIARRPHSSRSPEPQPQPDNGGAPFRTESGAGTPFLLLEGFQSFIGQSTVMMWGKAPYAPPGSIPGGHQLRTLRRLRPAVASSVPAPGRRRRGLHRRLPARHQRRRAASTVTATPSSTPITSTAASPASSTTGSPARRTTRAGRSAENWDPGVADVSVELWDPSAHAPPERRHDRQLQPGRPPAHRLPVARQRAVPVPGAGHRLLRRAAQFQPGPAGRASTAATRSAQHPGGQLRSRAPRRPVTFNNPISCEGMPAPCTPRRAMRPIPAGQVRREDHRAAGIRAAEGRGQERRLRRHVRAAAVLAERSTRSGTQSPSVLTKTAAPVSLSATTVTVVAGEGRNIHPGDQIIIDDEIMRVTATLGDVLTVLARTGHARRLRRTRPTWTSSISGPSWPRP